MKPMVHMAAPPALLETAARATEPTEPENDGDETSHTVPPRTPLRRCRKRRSPAAGASRGAWRAASGSRPPHVPSSAGPRQRRSGTHCCDTWGWPAPAPASSGCQPIHGQRPRGRACCRRGSERRHQSPIPPTGAQQKRGPHDKPSAKPYFPQHRPHPRLPGPAAAGSPYRRLRKQRRCAEMCGQTRQQRRKIHQRSRRAAGRRRSPRRRPGRGSR
mmetsp:Transcript_147838/g.474579  ORF Transcript_147838/g.474579 Transcript_147838/m.474579 type:complete len:216 (+) Transcript_147838:632-1279(+)